MSAESPELSMLLAAHPVLGVLSRPDREALARGFEPRSIEAGAVVLRQGDPATDYYLIAEGQFEIYAEEGRHEVPLGVAGAGDDFGEMALLRPGGVRAASVRALRASRCFALPEAAFRQLIATHPGIGWRFAEVAARHERVRFLKVATAFSGLRWNEVRQLADKLGVLELEPGSPIVIQGEVGKACYLLQSGHAQVVLEQARGGQRVLAELEPGAIVGEVSLLTDSPCNASVRTTERSRLLVLKREDFLELLGRSDTVHEAMLDLVELKARPRRETGITAHERRTVDGSTLYVLKNAARHSYYRLSSRGWFLWQRMDGESTFKDLTLAYAAEFGEFAPQRIGGVIAGLARSGFLTPGALAQRADPDSRGRRPVRRFLGGMRALLEWRVTLENVDAAFGRAYRFGGRWLFSKPGFALWLAVSGLGLALAVASLQSAAQEFFASDPLLLLGFIPAALLTAVLHECGHGLATKHVGREVAGAGVGWNWLGPVAFVDTTDTWLASPGQRVFVGLAGVGANLLVGALASLAAWSSTGTLALLAWQLAALNYLAVLINLNPLLEYDAYHLLVDVTGRIGMRRRAFRRLARAIVGGGPGGAAQAPDRLERLYLLGSLGYILAMIALALVLFRLLFEARLTAAAGAQTTQVVALLLPLAVALLASAGLWRDLHGARRAERLADADVSGARVPPG